MNDARLSVRRLSKSYAAPVLNDVDLSIRAGEIHAIVGENGAGKSTLIKIIAGLVPKDSGELLIDGNAYDPSGPADGFSAGISFAAQELTAIGTLSVAENIALRHLPATRGVVDRRRLGEIAAPVLGSLGMDAVSPGNLARNLSLADRQLLEIAKALAADAGILILDEPTAALTAPQAERVHDVISRRAADGAAVIYISHRLGDVLDVADTVTVLRDGRVVCSDAASSFTVESLVEHMAGRTFDKASPLCAEDDCELPLLSAANITTADLPVPISLTGHAGEIIGLAGLAGAGRSELLMALFGLAPLTGGSVHRYVDGVPTPVTSATRAVRAGIALLGEDRKDSGIFAGQSITHNVMVPGRQCPFARIDQRRDAAATRALVERLGIRCEGPEQDIAELSGGNQQKVLLGRWLNRDSAVFLLDEPTRGVDVATKSAIYDLLFELQRDGRCIILASSETEELMTLCNRIHVMSGRRLVASFDRGDFSEQAILATAFSAFSDTLPGKIH